MKSFAPRNYRDIPNDALLAAPQAGDEQCEMGFCKDRATRTGFCEGCLVVVAMMLKFEIGPIDSVVSKSDRELQYQLAVDDLVVTIEQCHHIRCYLIAEYRNLAKISLAEHDLLTRDFLRAGVRDTPANRERRAEFFGGLPRVHVPDPPVGFSPTELRAQNLLRREQLRRDNPDGAPSLEMLPCNQTSKPSVVLLSVLLAVLVLAAVYVALRPI